MALIGVLLHFIVVRTNLWIFHIVKYYFVFAIQGFVFSYPLISLLADIIIHAGYCLYHMQYCQYCMSILVPTDTIMVYRNISVGVRVVLLIALAIVGKGMFESTVMIQFGTDQMIEASSSQLSTFIHWYYWSLYIGNVCIDIIAAGIMGYLSYCHITEPEPGYLYYRMTVYKWFYFLLGIPQCCLCCITLLLLYLKKSKTTSTLNLLV